VAEEARIKFHGWREIGPVTLGSVGAEFPAKAFLKGPCRVLVSHEDHLGKMRWHLSISCKDRYPGWEEIKDARYSLLPLGLYFAMILPPPNEYLNIHPNCFHLWEIEEREW
jgi:hypothetical protein